MSRATTAAEVQEAFDASVEPSHYPHMHRALNPELLLASGCLSGPYRKTKPETLWSRAVRRALKSIRKAMT